MILMNYLQQQRCWQRTDLCTHCRKEKWSEVAQPCPTLCDPMDCSLPGSSVHGIFQARVAISFSDVTLGFPNSVSKMLLFLVCFYFSAEGEWSATYFRKRILLVLWKTHWRNGTWSGETIEEATLNVHTENVDSRDRKEKTVVRCIC